MNTVFGSGAFLEYDEWLRSNPKTARKINSLIIDIQRNGLDKGIGKPEKLKNSENYSRRIDDKNRLVYRNNEQGDLFIVSCKGHYDDK
jgi:toxin YoeB